MMELKMMYKHKNFQLNPLILKNLKHLNLTLNEFLLILYFINEVPSLDLQKIKETLGLTDEEILNTYSDLLNKSLIEVIVEKEKGIVIERISLESFYDKLILSGNINKEEVTEDVFTMFEKEFGRTLSPIEYETINKWIENGVKEEVITNALREAVINGAANLRYIDKIIYEWTKQGRAPKEETRELFDYDWVGGSNE